MELSERKEKILSAVIEHFIATGEPVGSKLLASSFATPLSSATIRNEMAFLSDNGFLEQPHTSAGRIPSDKGYRYYIDNLLFSFAPSNADMFRILSSIDQTEGDSVRILSQALDVLSHITGCAAVATTPHSAGAVIKSTQVVPVSAHKAMIVVSTSAGVLRSRLALTDSEISYELMELFYNVTAANFVGLEASEITEAKIQTAVASLGEMALDITPWLIAFFDAANEAAASDVLVKGQTNILAAPSLRNDASQIIEFLRNSDELSSQLLGDASKAVRIKIGNENEQSFMRNAAVVTAPYTVKDNTLGVIGVIGPSKMDYSKIIPLVKYISEAAGKLLAESMDI